MKIEKSYVKINQSNGLSGIAMVEGSKNSILPIAPLAILTGGISKLMHVPETYDIKSMIKLLSFFDIDIIYDKLEKSMTLDTRYISNKIPSKELMNSYRASTIVSGALLSRFNETWILSPGGDNIGKRPIDIHLESFKEFGAKIDYTDEHIYVNAKNGLKPANILFDYPSVGATQNAMIVASRIEGITVIRNCAQEPEISDLAEVLKNMGVDVKFEYPATIIINGNKDLIPFNHTVMPDRLEAATLLIAAAITNGAITIPNAPAYAMKNILKKLSQMGHEINIESYDHGVSIIACENPKAVSLKTMPFPGFSTDFQSPMAALLAVTEGKSSIHETVFESRMNHVYELNKMGAQIAVEYDCAKIVGVKELYGTDVISSDIRAAAALILAGLKAKGTTNVYGLNHLLRGYFKLNEKLQSLGADIQIIENILI
jgi:UDP-N-acetylglucosamine 1-carboxyvinyltransferase